MTGIFRGDISILFWLLQLKGRMESACRLRYLCFFYYTGDAYLRGSYHVDVDVAFSQSAEHSGRIARRILHSCANDADLSQVVGTDYLTASQTSRDLSSYFEGVLSERGELEEIVPAPEPSKAKDHFMLWD